MRTVELLLDQELEATVRDLWRRLSDAGLPSLAQHPHPTNRPHLTLITAASLPPFDPPMPIAAELGPVRRLGRALVLAVTPTPELRDLQATLWSSLAGQDPWPAPADWVPHVSLALKFPPDRRVELPANPARGHFVAARSYDTQNRTVVPLPSDRV
ncbi:MAG: 2'-5' RNA ligase family protein [Actinoplanes sp.]